MTTAGVRATARIGARADGRGGTALPVLEGEGRSPCGAPGLSGDEARVMLVGAMSRLLAVTASPWRRRWQGARLHVGSAAATIALPGQAKGEARYDVRLDVSGGG